MKRIGYMSGRGEWHDASIIAAYQEPNGRQWYAVWEPIRAEPIWIHPEMVQQVYEE